MITSIDILPGNGTVVTLELAKKHLNIESDFTDDDALIEGYIAGSVVDAEAYMGRTLGQVLVLNLNSFDQVDFETIPVVSGVVIQYAVLNSGDVEYVDLPSENYSFRQLKSDGMMYRLVFKGVLPVILPDTDNPIVVKVETSCPDSVRLAILLKVGKFYERREDTNEAPTNRAAINLMWPFRINM